MPVTVDELYSSRGIDRSTSTITIDRVYKVNGVDDPSEAEQYGPSFTDTDVHDGITLFVVNKKAERIAPNTCRLEVTYSNPGGGGGGSSSDLESWDMSLLAGSEHIDSVKKKDKQQHFGGESIYRGQAVGMIDGRIDGVDIFVPKATLTVTKAWEVDAITVAYLFNIYNLTGTVNATLFKSWPPGSLLFLGARVASAQQGVMPITYEFAGEINRTLQIELTNGEIETVEKKGWEYIWYEYERKKETAEGKTKIEPGIIGVHVAQVYESGNFALLDLNPELIPSGGPGVGL